MVVEEQFRALILAVPEVAALIEGRLYPIWIPPGVTFPAATYSVEDTQFDEATLEDQVIEHPQMQVTFWGFDYVALKTAHHALSVALRTGVFPAPLHAIQITAKRDVFDDKFQHADGVGLPGARLECQLIVTS